MVACKILGRFSREPSLVGSVVLETKSAGIEEVFGERGICGVHGCESKIIASEVFDGATAKSSGDVEKGSLV